MGKLSVPLFAYAENRSKEVGNGDSSLKQCQTDWMVRLKCWRDTTNTTELRARILASVEVVHAFIADL